MIMIMTQTRTLDLITIIVIMTYRTKTAKERTCTKMNSLINKAIVMRKKKSSVKHPVGRRQAIIPNKIKRIFYRV